MMTSWLMLKRKENNIMDAEDFVKDKRPKELSRFKTYAGNAVEGNVIRTYIETVWNCHE
ncbi:MAG: hypothetical protein ACLT2Z_06355 [Eubacterium sp.]